MDLDSKLPILFNMNEQEQLAKVFEGLGAQSKQALKMARQLLRRAEQVATEQNISRVESLRRLMRLCVEGFHGKIDPDFALTKREIEKK
jgi:hypothetical protein